MSPTDSDAPAEPQRLRLVTDDERAPAPSSDDPVDDLDLGDFVSVSEREAEVNKLFVAAFESAEARLNPWPDPDADPGSSAT